MGIDRPESELSGILKELINLSGEAEWVEFKRNNTKPEEIGEYISALANAAALIGKVHAYLVWGVSDGSHEIVGTKFKPSTKKIGNEELESWLLRQLDPKINFRFYTLHAEDKPVVILEISAAAQHPVRFKSNAFIRVGTYKKKLKGFPEKERELWRTFDQTPFERKIAADRVSSDDVLNLLDYPAYFNLLEIPLPDNREGILSALKSDEMIVQGEDGRWEITNLGAVLFAKRLTDFHTFQRKAPRVIRYVGIDRLEAENEEEVNGGYASNFDKIIYATNLRLDSREVIKSAFREQVHKFPELAVRELIANALIHQDFEITGTGPMIEIFSDRVEITNPGHPLVSPDRFLDSPPRSRNEALTSFMRRISICEERGSGIDKVVSLVEINQLPAPLFEIAGEHHTRTVLFSHRHLNDMDKAERVRACYLHTCLCYVRRGHMTNASLRERFGIQKTNRAAISRIIKETIDAGLICRHSETVGTRAMRYLPKWA